MADAGWSYHPKLTALLDGRIVGQIYQEPTGRFRFVYARCWREDPNAYPLSLSLPLAAAEHGHTPVSAFLWGLLPDNDRTLQHWGRMYSVSANNPVALLTHVGVDCAGAVQFVPPEGAAALVGAAHDPPKVEWLSEADVAGELRARRTLGISGGPARQHGQFSLAGAQPKTALFEERGRWGVTRGRMPTNRILKPPAHDLDAFAENEHICMELARSLGLSAARSRVCRFEDASGMEVAIVVERFDRRKLGGSYVRIHQEDCCQALGVAPRNKYENESGPSAARIFELIRGASEKPELDTARFLDVLALNWIIAATDAHAKNYSLLHAPGRRVRLAPFYDIASYLPYDSELHKVKLAMKIGGEYLIRRIGARHWEDFARRIGLDDGIVRNRVRDLAARVPDAVQDVRRRAESGGLARRAVRPLAAHIVQRAKGCQADFR